MLHVRRLLRRQWPLLIVVPLLVFFLFPYIWLVSSAFKPVKELMTVPPRFLPEQPTLANFIDVLGREQTRQVFLNSILVTGITLALTLLLGSGAAYALSTYRFRGRHVLLLATLATQLFPAVIIVVPLYRTWAQLGLLNTYQALSGTYIAYTLPLAVWMLTGYMRTIPYEVVEAALVDGANRVQLYRLIVLPLSLPGIAATAVYVSLAAWNEFIFAVTFATAREVRTVTVGLYSFIGEQAYDWNLILTMAVLMALPVICLFLFLQRFLVRGLTAGATKG
jgi:ABC-type glycerol-3-phosphate transport system permease component